MKIIWSEFASKTLREIFEYHKTVAGTDIADRLIAKIFNSTEQLINFPNSGQIEETLEKLKEGHRYLVIGNYKIIYKVVQEGILITDVFDTRQDPGKINDPKRK